MGRGIGRNWRRILVEVEVGDEVWGWFCWSFGRVEVGGGLGWVWGLGCWGWG